MAVGHIAAAGRALQAELTPKQCMSPALALESHHMQMCTDVLWLTDAGGHCRDRQGDLRSGEQMSRALIDTTTPGLGYAVRRH